MFVKYCIRPIIEKIEGAMSSLMSRYPGGERAYIKFSLDALLRADLQPGISLILWVYKLGFTL